MPRDERSSDRRRRGEVDQGWQTWQQQPDREKALGLALAQIDKQFGKGSVMRLGERPVVPMAVIPTGSIALDVALGIGGLPRGRVDRDLRPGVQR